GSLRERRNGRRCAASNRSARAGSTSAGIAAGIVVATTAARAGSTSADATDGRATRASAEHRRHCYLCGQVLWRREEGRYRRHCSVPTASRDAHARTTGVGQATIAAAYLDARRDRCRVRRREGVLFFLAGLKACATGARRVDFAFARAGVGLAVDATSSVAQSFRAANRSGSSYASRSQSVIGAST